VESWRIPLQSGTRGTGETDEVEVKAVMHLSILKDLLDLLRSGLTVQIGVTQEVRALGELALFCFAVSLVLRIFRR
jgi:hypothetical protein